jgi:asparagine synthase (glutamine-hydrolysing)
MFILSIETKNNVTVALSGDGADEVFSGYNKHDALWMADRGGAKNTLVKTFGGVASKLLPASRDSKLGNIGRKLGKFSDGLKLTSSDRYVEWASFMETISSERLTAEKFRLREELSYLSKEVKDFNDYLYRDFKLVLEGDMLRKVDSMSMANSLEVRTPFLDYRLVDLVFSMPSAFKIAKGDRKRILKDAFKDELPSEIFNRGKHGFEVPLRKWFNVELKETLSKEVFNRDLIESQGFLNWEEVENIQRKLYSSNPGDAVYNTWALLGFQRWLSNYYYN